MVPADPSLADKGGAATYGMMAHIPLRGMVKSRVLDMFANLYHAGGGEIDLTAPAHAAGGSQGDGAAREPLADRLARWYVQWKQR